MKANGTIFKGSVIYIFLLPHFEVEYKSNIFIIFFPFAFMWQAQGCRMVIWKPTANLATRLCCSPALASPKSLHQCDLVAFMLTLGISTVAQKHLPVRPLQTSPKSVHLAV